MATTKSQRRGADNAQAADQASLENSMGYLVRRTHRAFTRSLEKRLAEYDISISMWFFFRLLWIQDGQTQKELGDELGLTQPTTVSAMDNMEQRGYIARKRNLEDRRKVNIFLTPAGRAMEKKLLRYAAEVNTVALHDFTAQEKKQLMELLLRANRALAHDTA